MSEERQVVARARVELREEHDRLRLLLERLRAEADRGALATLLAELPASLADHFRREEEPGGFYEKLGVALDAARGELGRLVDDHFRLITMARDLAEAAQSPHVTTIVLREQAARVADYLADHEQRENDLAHGPIGQA